MWRLRISVKRCVRLLGPDAAGADGTRNIMNACVASAGRHSVCGRVFEAAASVGLEQTAGMADQFAHFIKSFPRFWLHLVCAGTRKNNRRRKCFSRSAHLTVESVDLKKGRQRVASVFGYCRAAAVKQKHCRKEKRGTQRAACGGTRTIEQNKNFVQFGGGGLRPNGTNSVHSPSKACRRGFAAHAPRPLMYTGANERLSHGSSADPS